MKTWNVSGEGRCCAGAEILADELLIDHVVPGEQSVAIGWTNCRTGSGFMEITPESGEGKAVSQRVDLEQGYGCAEGLEPGAAYTIRLLREEEGDGAERKVGPARRFRTGAVPGTVINYIHPDDTTYEFSGRSPASPSIVKLPDGRLVVSHDVYWGDYGQNLSLIFRSDDDGRTWSFLTHLYPCFWGKLFVHRDELYMLATSTEYGALQIGKSVDGGETWTAPALLLEGGTRERGGPHKAPMPVIVYRDRLWTSIDYGAWKAGGHKTGLLSAPVDADLLDRSSWTVTPFLPYDANWPGAIQGGTLPNLLEGNAVVDPTGRLIVIPRYQTSGGVPHYGRTVLLYADVERPEAPLTFGKVIDFHGNMSKFTVRYDEPSGKYWALVNRVTGPKAVQRNILTLVCSRDTENWEIVADLLDYEHNGWPEDLSLVGFQYVDWIIDGDDILYVSRTAINGAYNFHNANYITFHHIPNFRLSAGEEGALV
ncbi:MAG: glycosyl hydrolase repeat-containing glycosyl hydrolase [Paenibacillus sp.]|nr:glycosyl hydrolase repeat-containing glycosyl hydrolase [Paenibacillus sp.]